MRRRIATFVALAAALLGVTVLGISATGAGAQSSSFLLVRKIDAPSAAGGPVSGKMDFVWTGNQGDLAGLKLTANGNQLTPTAPAAPLKSTGTAVVFVVDSGKPGMDASGALVSARDGIEKFVAANPSVLVGVVQAGDTADTKVDLTSNGASINAALATIGPTNGSAVWGGLSLAGGMLKSNPNVQPNIVLIAGDNDNVAPGNEAVGRTAVLGSGATMWSLEMLGTMDPAPYDSLVTAAGGQVLTTDTGSKVAGLVSSAGNTIMTQQYEIGFDATGLVGQPTNFSLTVGDQTSSADVLVPGTYQGGQALRPVVAPSTSTIPLFDNEAVLILALALVLVAAAGAAYALTSVFVKDDLSNVLQPYAGGAVEDTGEEESALQKSALMQRAVALTEQVAENQGMLTRAEVALERANLPLRAGEALVFYALIVIGVTVVALVFSRNIVVGLVFGIIAALTPPAVVNFVAGSRRKKFMAQLPDTLSLLSGTLRAGYSLMQGVEAVSQEVDEPMGLELRRVVTESRLGRPLEESLEASAERMDSPDFAWAVMAIRIQREVGGNLAELLMTVADTMVQRERLRRDVRTLTAEGRMSAYVLGFLPIGLGVIMYVLNPEYIGTLFTDTLGIILLVLAGVAMLVGFLWMRKIINIEI